MKRPHSRILGRIFGTEPWKKEWQDELAETVEEAQKGLAINMVVIVARESDIYSEILFIFSFLGLSLGALASYLMRNSGVHSDDLLLLPLAGFAAGSTLYTMRRFYIQKVAPQAVRDRAANKAKAQFFDHSHGLDGKLALIYFSELEREAFFLTSPEVTPHLKNSEIQEALSQLLARYQANDPLKSIRPALLRLGTSLKTHLPDRLAPDAAPSKASMMYMGGSDRIPRPLKIPILKGNKDVN